MNKLSKIALALSLAVAGMAAQAQASYSASNVGHINNSSSASATVNGIGSSYSKATGEQKVTSVAAAGALGGSFNTSVGGIPLAVTGGLAGVYTDVKTESVATGFNLSSGTGVGLAESKGYADGGAKAAASWNAPGQTLSLNATTDGGSYQNNPNGSDVAVTATTNRDGFAASSTAGNASGYGGVGSVVIPGVGAVVALHIEDSKSNEATAETGRITFTGTQPANQSAATTMAHGASASTFEGYSADPVGTTGH